MKIVLTDLVDDPYFSLMRFSDPLESETVLGPLFSTAAKTDVAIYGPEKFIRTEARQKMLAEVKDAIRLKGDPVIKLITTDQLPTSDTTSDENKIKALQAVR